MTWLIFDTTTNSIGFSGTKTSAPEHVIQFECTKDDENKIMSGMYKFDHTRMEIVDKSYEEIAAIVREEERISKLKYLSSTDWIVLRHIREKSLGNSTSLTEEDYLELERKRQEAAKSI